MNTEITDFAPMMNWRNPYSNLCLSQNDIQEQLAILWNENNRLSKTIEKMKADNFELEKRTFTLIQEKIISDQQLDFFRKKIIELNKLIPVVIPNIIKKSVVDLDSILAMIEPQSLVKLAGIKCFLGSSRYRPHGDPIIKTMTLLVNYPIQIYVEKSEKNIICEELSKKGIIFQKSCNIEFVAKKQVSISTRVLMRALIDCKISQVRVVVHDLKDPFFAEYLKEIVIIPHESNRLDFGEYVTSNYKIFQKEKLNEEIFPMFLSENWEDDEKERWGSLRSGNCKAYPTIIHNLKRMGTISFNPVNMTRYVLQRSVIELENVINNTTSTKMRYEVSLFPNKTSNSHQIIKDGIVFLNEWKKEVGQREFISIDLDDWLKKVKELLNLFSAHKIWSSERVVGKDECFYYCIFLNTVGYSFDPINRPIKKGFEEFWPLESIHELQNLTKTKLKLKENKEKRDSVKRNEKKKSKIIKKVEKKRKKIEKLKSETLQRNHS